MYLFPKDDMVTFLEDMSKAAVEFLDSIPGEQEAARYKLYYFKKTHPN